MRLPGTGSFKIDDGANLEFDSSVAAGATVTFSGAGTLQLTSPTSFSGEITGIIGSDEILDFTGYNTSTTASTDGGYNPSTNTTALMVTDPGHSTVELTLAGNLSASSWTVSPDSDGTGVDIFDPPATSPSTHSQYPATTEKEATPVRIGGPGDDNFIFHSGIEAETATNLNPRAATVEFDRFAQLQINQHLMSLITSDPHGDTISELGHHDNAAIHDLTQNQLCQHLQSLAQLY